MAEIYGLGGVVGAWLILKVLRKQKSEEDGEDWDTLFEKARHDGHSSHGKSKDGMGGRRRSLSSTEAVELRAKLDAIANSYRAAETELEAMRTNVKTSEAERDRLLAEKDKLASDLRAKTRQLLKINAEKRAAAQKAEEEKKMPLEFGPPQFLPGDGTPVRVEDAEPPKLQEFEFSSPAKQQQAPPQVQPPWQSAPPQPHHAPPVPQPPVPVPPPTAAPPQPPALLSGDPKLLKELDDIRRELEQAMAAGSSLPLPYKDMLMRRMQAIQAQLQGQPTVASLPQQPSLGPAVPPFSGAAQAAPRVPMPPAMPPAVPPFGMPPAAAAPPPPYGMIPPGIQPAMPPYGGGLMPPGMMGMAPPGAWPPTAVSAPPYGGYHGAPNGADSVSRISQTSNTGAPKRASQDGGTGRARRMSQDEKLEVLAKKKIGVVRKKATWGDEFANGS